MGLFWTRIPDHLVQWSKDQLGCVATVIETGTFRGDSAKYLSLHFASVFTIEMNENLALKATQRFRRTAGVKVVRGTSVEVMSDLLPLESQPCLFWLDAHFSGGNTSGMELPCPLLDELRIILSRRSSTNTIILIDDARGLDGGGGWPRLDEILSLTGRSGYGSILSDDVLVNSSPESLVALAPYMANSRTSVFEPLGGRLGFLIFFIRLLRLPIDLLFHLRHSKFRKFWNAD